jgi:hypothetical protein
MKILIGIGGRNNLILYVDRIAWRMPVVLERGRASTAELAGEPMALWL